MSTAPKITSCDVIFLSIFQRNHKVPPKSKSFDFKPFLPHMSSEMIFNEVVPHTSKNKADKTITFLSTIY